jgi:ureidoglycolate hydrolase
VDATGTGLRCAVMYRHATHTQVLTPLDADSVLAVAPASTPFASAADLEDVRAFVLHPGETIVLHRGTWHWGPFPIGGAHSVRLLNVQGRRYAEDNASVDLPARTGRAIEVVSP